MASTFKNAPIQLTTTQQTIYTCPALTSVVVIGCRVANKDGVNSANVDLVVTISSVDYYYGGADTPIPPGSALNVLAGEKLVLEAGDSIKATASANGDLDAIVSVLELT